MSMRCFLSFGLLVVGAGCAGLPPGSVAAVAAQHEKAAEEVGQSDEEVAQTKAKAKANNQRLVRGTIGHMHEKFCAEVMHLTHMPCRKHKMHNEALAKAEELTKNMEDGEEKHAVTLQQQTELQGRLALIDEEGGAADKEASDNDEMHAWFCGQDSAKAATKGSGVRIVCDHWSSMTKNMDHDANHHMEREHNQQQNEGKVMPVELRRQNAEMTKKWCAVDDRWTTHGPCMRYVLRAKFSSMNETEQAEKMPLVRLREQEIRDKVSREMGEKQFGDMHDWWCARPEVLTADEDSDVKRFCLGWEEHKADIKAEL